MKCAIILLLVCLAGLVCGQTPGMAGMSGMSGMAGMAGMAGGSGSSNALRSMLARRMMSGRGGPMPPGLQMLMLSQGIIESPMEMMACRTMNFMCLMMITRR